MSAATPKAGSPVTPASPTSPPRANSRLKAYDGAYAAYLAEHKARNLQSKQNKSIAFTNLYDDKLPHVTMSHPAFVEETERAQNTESSTVNPLFTTNADRQRPTYHGCPSSLTDDRFFACAQNELRSLSLKPSAKTVMSTPEAQAATKGSSTRTTTMSVEEALRLKALLSDPNCRLDFIDLTAALDSLQNPQPQPTPERLAEARAVIVAQFGEAETEESTEKLQAAVDQLKGTYETYAEGLTFLAAKRLERMSIIADALVVNQSLNEVRLGSNNFGAPSDSDGRSFYQPLNRLERFIDHNKTVRILDLSYNRAGPKGVGIIAKAMCKNISIHTLNLSGNDLMVEEAPEEEEDPEFVEDDAVFGELYEALEALSEMVKKNKFLRSLSLRNNFIKPQDVNEDDDEDMGTDTPIMKFFEPFKKYHRIEVLDLSANELGDTGIRLLCSCLKENQSVRHLDISSNGITSKGLKFIADWLKDSEHIDTLVAQNNLFAPKVGTKSKKAIATAMASARSFADAMATNKTLQILNLSSNHFGPEMSAELLSRLSEASELIELYFDSNELCSSVGGTDFTPIAITHIYNAIAKQGSSLATLSLAGNYIQYQGIVALSVGPTPAAEDGSPTRAPSPSMVATSALKGIVTLNLSRNAIGDEGLVLLAKGLATDAVIANLTLSYNGITSPQPLVQVLRSPSVQLATLDLSHNNLGSDTSESAVRNFGVFSSAVAMSGGIQSLNLSYNELSYIHGPALASIARASACPLSTLTVVGNPFIGIAATVHILSELKSNRNLRTFRITTPSTGNHAVLVEAVIDLLTVNRVLTDVDCSLNMGVAEEQGIATIQKLLLMNGLRLSPSLVDGLVPGSADGHVPSADHVAAL